MHVKDECTFSYGFRPKNQVDLSGLEYLPFQVQILYKRPDGTEILRVATARIKITQDRQEAEKNVNVNVVATHVAQRAASKAKKGDYKNAQLEMRAAQRLMGRANVDEKLMSKWSSNVDSMDSVLRENRSDDDEDNSDNTNNNNNNDAKKESKDRGSPGVSRKKKVNKRTDKAAKKISQFTQANESDLFE